MLFALAFAADHVRAADYLPFAHTWVGFFLLAGLTFCALLGLGFVAGFTRRQRLNATNRIRTLLGMPDKPLPQATGRPSS